MDLRHGHMHCRGSAQPLAVCPVEHTYSSWVAMIANYCGQWTTLMLTVSSPLSLLKSVKCLSLPALQRQAQSGARAHQLPCSGLRSVLQQQQQQVDMKDDLLHMWSVPSLCQNLWGCPGTQVRRLYS